MNEGYYRMKHNKQLLAAYDKMQVVSGNTNFILGGTVLAPTFLTLNTSYCPKELQRKFEDIVDEAGRQLKEAYIEYVETHEKECAQLAAAVGIQMMDDYVALTKAKDTLDTEAPAS